MAEIEPSEATVLMIISLDGDVIYCWPSLLHYQFKGDVKGPMLFEKGVNRLAGVVHLLWGEGTVTGLQ